MCLWRSCSSSEFFIPIFQQFVYSLFYFLYWLNFHFHVLDSFLHFITLFVYADIINRLFISSLSNKHINNNVLNSFTCAPVMWYFSCYIHVGLLGSRAHILFWMKFIVFLWWCLDIWVWNGYWYEILIPSLCWVDLCFLVSVALIGSMECDDFFPEHASGFLSRVTTQVTGRTCF